MNATSAEESYLEIAFAVEKVQKVAMDTRIELVIREDKIFISDLELQVAFKEKVLKSNKDAEDAMYLRKLLGKAINLNKLMEYEELVKHETR